MLMMMMKYGVVIYANLLQFESKLLS